MANSFSFTDFLSPSFIKINACYKDQKSFFSDLNKTMLGCNYVESSYLDNIIEREKLYPTGLITPQLNIAIPHTESKHIKKPFIFITQLDKPLSFYAMGSVDKKIDVDWIFSLGVTHAETQLILLQKLMFIFSHKNLVQTLVSLKTIEEIHDFLINLKFITKV